MVRGVDVDAQRDCAIQLTSRHYGPCDLDVLVACSVEAFADVAVRVRFNPAPLRRPAARSLRSLFSMEPSHTRPEYPWRDI
jgi:hypothetical protein